MTLNFKIQIDVYVFCVWNAACKWFPIHLHNVVQCDSCTYLWNCMRVFCVLCLEHITNHTHLKCCCSKWNGIFRTVFYVIRNKIDIFDFIERMDKQVNITKYVSCFRTVTTCSQCQSVQIEQIYYKKQQINKIVVRLTALNDWTDYIAMYLWET